MAAATLIVPAPAKLNLFLHVTGRRGDGYHLLESLLALIDFGDIVTLSVREDGQIVLSHPLPEVPVESDLTYRAARLLQQHARVDKGVTIGLDKRVPMGAGLGGGSSDAASVLLALNRLWNLQMSREDLMRLGLQLGADVPFFIFGSNAHATGIGEVFRPVTLPRMHALIEVPPVHCATAEVFAASELTRDSALSNADAFAPDFGRNDLQPVATMLHHAIETAVRALDSVDPVAAGRKALTSARMTGSGSAAFRLFEKGFPASEVAWRAARDGERQAWKTLQRIHYRSPKLRGANGSLTSASRLVLASIIPRHPLRDFVAK